MPLPLHHFINCCRVQVYVKLLEEFILYKRQYSVNSEKTIVMRNIKWTWIVKCSDQFDHLGRKRESATFLSQISFGQTILSV